MQNNRRYFSSFVSLISYPDNSFSENCQNAAAELSDFVCDEDRFQLNLFIDRISKMKRGELEELYTSTFDINGICSLDVGYLVFGEDYKRGEFLVRVNEVHRQNGIALGTELGDHLTNLLQLISISEEDEFVNEFVQKILLVACDKMLAAFSYNKDNPFYIPLSVIHRTLELAFNNTIYERVQL